MVMNNGYWPADMSTEILLKLPVKSIIRFKCVAKTWCHLFQNPTFISQHHSISKNNKRLLVYFRDGNNDNAVRLFVDQALVSYHDLPQQCLPSHFASSPYLDMYEDNGLICLLDSLNSALALWNPATREFKILPECTQNLQPNTGHDLLDTLGFGLNPLSNDYKVIYLRDYLDLETKMQRSAHAIYSMSTDSWRVFKEEEVEVFKDHQVHSNVNKTCANGVYYWVAFKADDDLLYYDYKVLTLNLGTEIFQLIDSPLSECPGELLLFQDRIAIWVTHNFHPDVKISNEIWVLNDEEEEGHWSKVLKIEPGLDVETMFGFWENGKLLIESLSGELLLYDLEKDEAKELGIQTRGADFLNVHPYEESLVAIRKE